MSEDLKVIRGTVTKTFHVSAKFSAGRLLPNREDVTRGGEIAFAGKCYVREGEYVALQGRWVDDPKWGRQFKVESRLHEDKVDVAGLAGWLAVHGKAHGIGPVKAEKIAREFGENFLGVLNDNPEQVAIFAQVPLYVVRELADDWKQHEELNVIGTKLAAYELTAHQIHALYEKFKGSIIPMLEANPYLLVGEVPGLGFKRVDEIAKKLGTPDTHPGRLAAAILYCLWQERDQGSTCAERGNLLGSAVEVLDYREDDAETLLGEALEKLTGKGGRVVELKTAEGRCFYALPSEWKYENFVSDFLKTSNGDNTNFSEEFFCETGDLDESQRRAVRMALKYRACLISGGAGAGKTYLLKTITGIYRGAGLRVSLCAPTGKAARRIEEVVGHEAQTIHRLLGYRPPEGFPETTLDTDVVICDEASMISADLAYYLFRAIGPDTALVLVGDHHQLPPVGAGALLRDCIQHELLPMTILNQCHRQAGVLKKNCSAILLGEVHPTHVESDSSIPWVVMRRLETTAAVLEYLESLYTRGLAEKLGVDPLRDVQFLTPQHGGPLGTRALNVLFQRLHQKERGVEVDPVEPDSRPPILVGDKVIQTKNNYKLEIMNGHQGFVVNTSPLVVDFGDDKIVSIPSDCKGEIELAYALTPHKVQGSEFPVAVTVVHRCHTYMLHRNWLYTASTRARRCCVLVGDDVGVSRAAKTIRVNERRTLLPLLANIEGFHVESDS